MSKKFIIFVIDDLTNSGTPAEMKAIDAFNDQMRENGQWIFAGGLAAPSAANVIDNRAGAGVETGKPLFGAAENFSGFWLIEAASSDVARELALAGSKACNRKVELRPLL
ncbi:YCII-related [Candidatus Nanopelagicaceae bacterium]